MIKNETCGGLRMVKLDNFITALKVTWVRGVHPSHFRKSLRIDSRKLQLSREILNMKTIS